MGLFVQVDLQVAFDAGFQLVAGFLEFGQTLPQGLGQVGKLPGAKYDQGDDEDDDQFRKADAEHLGLTFIPRIDSFREGVNDKKQFGVRSYEFGVTNCVWFRVPAPAIKEFFIAREIVKISVSAGDEERRGKNFSFSVSFTDEDKRMTEEEAESAEIIP
jgi:hypothetical protein